MFGVGPATRIYLGAGVANKMWLIPPEPASTASALVTPLGTCPVTVIPSRCASAAITGTSAGFMLL